MTTLDRTRQSDVVRRLTGEADSLDHAVYDAIANTPIPTLDVPARWLSKAANYSVLSILIAGVLGPWEDTGAGTPPPEDSRPWAQLRSSRA